MRINKAIAGVFLALAMTLGVAGCKGMASKVARLDVGKDRDEVIHRLGPADSDRTMVGYEVMSWIDRRPGRFSLSRKDYTVIFKDGKVVQYGPGLVRRDGKTSLQIETNDP